MTTTRAQQLLVRDVIVRDLGKEIPGGGVVKVAETSALASDLNEYVLTTQLATEYQKVLSRVVEASHAASGGTDRVGVWISGFFGTGKSHFAKLAGHLLADTPTDAGSARTLFRKLLHSDRPADQRLAELFQEADSQAVKAQLVAFDITALSGAAEEGVGLIFMRAFFKSLGLSSVLAFAERELELQAEGKYEEFLTLYQAKTSTPWADDRDLLRSGSQFAACLAELMPTRYQSTELAHENLRFATDALRSLTVDEAVGKLVAWTKGGGTGSPRLVVFVADEVGAWANRRLARIEQVRALVEQFAAQGAGRLWIFATSQERLSDVVSNSQDLDSARESEQLLERLEARFPVNVHLESSEVGNVIEDRILRKKAVTRRALEGLWDLRQGVLTDIAAPPGVELGGNYPLPERERFVRDYPFLPYQLPAAGDIFGAMRSVKVSSGARSMLKVALDATAKLAQEPLARVVSWDLIFDSANRGNEFADEQYLGSQGLEYLASADRDLADIVSIGRPSRLLKVLWLAQQTRRIPRTVRNLTRLLVDDLNVDVLRLERDVEATLEQLEARSFVRSDPASSEWRFLTPDEVTVERIVAKLTADIREGDIRAERQKLIAERLRALLPGRLTMGATSTPFEYAILLNESPLVNADASVRLKVSLADTAAAGRAREEYAMYLSTPEVHWVIQIPDRVDQRLRRAIAIWRLQNEEDFQRIASQKTRDEARRLEDETSTLREDATRDVDDALGGGTLYWGGGVAALKAGHKAGSGPSHAKAQVETAIRDRIALVFDRFPVADRPFDARNVDRLSSLTPAARAGLDPALGLFDSEGHVHGNHPVVEEIVAFVRSSSRTEGQEVAGHFRAKPYGWPSDLVRYVAAAMFVDGKLTLVDRAGRRYDNPKDSTSRAQLGTGPFKSVQLEIEENPATPQEIAAARALLAELKVPTADASEATVAEAIHALQTALTGRLAVVARAEQVGLPLPEIHVQLRPVLDELVGAGSRAKRVRALLANGDVLRAGSSALMSLESFVDSHGLDQFSRAKRLLAIAVDAGLLEDPTWGSQLADAQAEMLAIETQKRVLDEWSGAYQDHRATVIHVVRSIYQPLRDEARTRTAEAAAAITDSPYFVALDVTRAAHVRGQFLAPGRPLAEIPVVELKTEPDLISANEAYSLAHLRARLASIDGELSAAQTKVIELLADQQRETERAVHIEAWSPSRAFAGATFHTEAEVDAAFDGARDQVKAVVRLGKTVKVV